MNMSVNLTAEKREVRPRSLRKQLRHEGKALGVVYGYKVESTPIAFEEKELLKIVRENGENVLISLKLAGKNINVLINRRDMDVFTPTVDHVELKRQKSKQTSYSSAKQLVLKSVDSCHRHSLK